MAWSTHISAATEKLPLTYQAVVDTLVNKLQSVLGQNLYACVLYGSAVRGDLVSGVSDLNLLLVLNESTPEAHAAIAECLRGRAHVDPFVIARSGMQRSMAAFAVKFRSISRDYRVLCGEDPFREIAIDQGIARFLCEQAVRNLRLRAVRAFILFGGDGKQYLRFLHHIDAKVFIALSDALRLNGVEIPHDFAERIPVLAAGFDTDVSILNDLLVLKRPKTRLCSPEIREIHGRLFRLLDHVVRWMEKQWPGNL